MGELFAISRNSVSTRAVSPWSARTQDIKAAEYRERKAWTTQPLLGKLRAGGWGCLAGAEGPAPPPHSPLLAGEPQGSPSLPAPLSYPGLFLEALRSSDLLGWEWAKPPKDRAPRPRPGPSGLPASQFARGFWFLWLFITIFVWRNFQGMRKRSPPFWRGPP